MFRAPYAPSVQPSTTSRTELDLGAGLTVPIFVFKATDEAKVPSLKLYSLREDGAADAPHTVKRDTQYRRVDDLEGDWVPDPERMKGALRTAGCTVHALQWCADLAWPCAAFRYGKELVPVNSGELASMKVRRAVLCACRRLRVLHADLRLPCAVQARPAGRQGGRLQGHAAAGLRSGGRRAAHAAHEDV